MFRPGEVSPDRSVTKPITTRKARAALVREWRWPSYQGAQSDREAAPVLNVSVPAWTIPERDDEPWPSS